MRVLIACEYTGTERDAFTAAGHDAMSCDLLPTETPGEHYQGDVRDLLAEPFDLVIALHGADLFRAMFGFNTSRLAVENPIQHKWARMAHGQGEPTQYVQPWQFGHPETKATGLWLRGLPPLVPTDDVRAVMAALPVAQRNRIHYASPGPDRGKLRSAAYPGIAAAMADQWADA